MTGLPTIFVREQAKTYGTCRLAEAPDVAGRTVTLIEDVITTGGAVRNAASVMAFPDVQARNDWLQVCFQTGTADGVPDPFAEIIQRLAATTTLINDFYWQLHDGQVQTELPSTASPAMKKRGTLVGAPLWCRLGQRLW
jgi:hypothetical protein